MGQFSWLDCVDGKQIIDGYAKTSYVLVPKEFGGGSIAESRYDGYGHFGAYDIYDLILDWNKDYIPQYLKQMKSGNWECDPSDSDMKELQNYYKNRPIDVEERWLGIILACYDEDNERLKYPIKITYHPDVTYEECNPSLSDPNQGWGTPDELKSSEAWISLTAIFAKGTWNSASIAKAIRQVFSANNLGSPKISSRNDDRDFQPDTYPEEVQKKISIDYVGSITFDDCEDMIDDLFTAVESVGGNPTDYWIDVN